MLIMLAWSLAQLTCRYVWQRKCAKFGVTCAMSGACRLCLVVPDDADYAWLCLMDEYLANPARGDTCQLVGRGVMHNVSCARIGR